MRTSLLRCILTSALTECTVGKDMEHLFVQPPHSFGKVESSIRKGARRDEALRSDEPRARERWQRFALIVHRGAIITPRKLYSD